MFLLGSLGAKAQDYNYSFKTDSVVSDHIASFDGMRQVTKEGNLLTISKQGGTTPELKIPIRFYGIDLNNDPSLYAGGGVAGVGVVSYLYTGVWPLGGKVALMIKIDPTHKRVELEPFNDTTGTSSAFAHDIKVVYPPTQLRGVSLLPLIDSLGVHPGDILWIPIASGLKPGQRFRFDGRYYFFKGMYPVFTPDTTSPAKATAFVK